MPKMKSRKAAAKRFSVTATGKVKRRKANLRHILEKRTSKRKRNAGKDGLVCEADIGRVRRMLPYAF